MLPEPDKRSRHPDAQAATEARAGPGWTPDLALLAALLALTVVFGRPFSKLGVHHLHLYVTEPSLLAIAVLGVARCGPRGAWQRVRAAIPAWLLWLYWVAGAIAAVRGLQSFGLSKVVYDVGLAEYSLLLALVPIVVDSRRRALLLFRVLVAASLASTVLYAAIRFAFPARTPFGSPDYAVGIYLSIFVLAVAGRLVVGLRVGRDVLILAAAAAALIAWLPARTVWVAMLAAVVALAVLAPGGRRVRVAVLGVAAFMLAQAAAYPLQRIEDSRIAAPSAKPAAEAASPGVAIANPGYVADDGLSAMTGGRVVYGHAAQGRLSRQVARSEVLDLGALEGLHPGKAYTIVFSVEPRSPTATVGRVGDTGGTGWGAAVFRTAPKVAWQTFRRRLVATSTTERLALIADAPGAASVRFDALRVIPGWIAATATGPKHGRPPTGQRKPAPSKQGTAAVPSAAPRIVSDIRGTLNSRVATAKTANLNMRWRLAIWAFQLKKWAHEPLFGVGFGRPTDFRWNVTGGVYDARTGSGSQDVTGPHNSFVNLLFRMGLAGALPLLALVVLAAVRLRRWLRVPRADEDKALVLALAAVFVFVVATATFSVALEGPYMGIFFWATLALLFATPRLLEGEPFPPMQAGQIPATPVPVRTDARRLTGAFRSLPWPLALIALWTAVIQVGGPRAAKLGLHGPLYPTEVVFAIAFAGLFLRRAWRRDRLAAIRAAAPPRWIQATVLLFAVAFAVALARGLQDYGSGVVKDAGLGYILLVPLIAFAFVDRPQWQQGFLDVLFWASVATVPVLVLEYTNGNTIAPLSLSLGFVLLFSLAPLLDDWLHGTLPWIGRVYVLAVPVFVVWEVKSRSALSSLVVGLLIIVALNLRGSRRQMIALGSTFALVVAAIACLVIAPGTLDKVPPVTLIKDTLNLAQNTKGNNARWRLDFSGALLNRSIASAPNVLEGVGLGRPSRFLWHEDCCHVQAYDFRGGPIPKNVIPNGDVSGPHNGFVDVVYRLGWPAALALIGILVFAMGAGARALRSAHGRDARSIRVLLAATAAGVIVLLTSDALRVPEAAVPFACVVGLLAARGMTASRAAAGRRP